MVTFKWLKDYQEAFAGVTTLGAAIIAFAAIRWQVRREAEFRWMEQTRSQQKILHVIAVDFDIANGNYANGITTWPGSDFAILDQFAVEMASYDASLLELGKRARTLLGQAIASSNLQSAELMAYAAHEAFRQAGSERRRPATRHAHFDASKLRSKMGSQPETTLRDLRHYFSWV